MFCYYIYMSEVRQNDGESNDGNADDQSVLPSGTTQNSNVQCQPE